MAASTSDKFTDTYNSANPNVAKVTASRTAAATTLTCDNLAGWPTVTKVHFSTYQIDTSSAVVAGTQIDWEGIVSGNSIGSLTRLAGATDAGNSIGDIVEMNPTGYWGHDLYSGLTQDHDSQGRHKTLADANGKTWLSQTATPSAVNYLDNANAATGNAPVLSVAGTDSNVGLSLKTKGTGVHQLLDGNGNAVLKTAAGVASAVNQTTITNAATGNAPQIGASGTDSNIDVRIVPKGTGNVKRGTTGGSIDWYEEIGRTTLGSSGGTISVTSLPARKYLKVLVYATATGGTIGFGAQFNGDTAANYSYRNSSNGGADATVTSTTSALISTGALASPMQTEAFVVNVAAQEKLVQFVASNYGASGAGTAPTRLEGNGKWANTSAQISRVDVINLGTGSFDVGSTVIVLGHD